MEQENSMLDSKKPTTRLHAELAEFISIPHPTYVRPILILYRVYIKEWSNFKS
jgi:hypothetical protein